MSKSMGRAHHYPPKFLSNMPKIPTHDVYFVVKKPGVKDGKKQRDVWTRIGPRGPHGDSKGFNVHFEIMPYELLTDKRLVLLRAGGEGNYVRGSGQGSGL